MSLCIWLWPGADLETVTRWEEIVCSWEFEEEEWERGAQTLQWNALFGLMHRKQALTRQEIRSWAQAGLYFPFRAQMGLVRARDTGAPAFVNTWENNAAVLFKGTLSACDGWVLRCHEVLSFSDLPTTPSPSVSHGELSQWSSCERAQTNLCASQGEHVLLVLFTALFER